MLLVYGWFTAELSSKRPTEIVCHCCRKTGSVHVSRSVVLAQLFYIPLFPVKIIDSFHCVSCLSDLNYREMNDETKAFYVRFKSRRFPRFWHFTGPLLLLLAFGFFKYSHYKEQSVFLERLETSKPGLTIEYETQDDNFTSMLICDTNDSTVYVIYNNYTVEYYESIDNILQPGFYSKDTIAVERTYLEDLVRSGKVKSVHW